VLHIWVKGRKDIPDWFGLLLVFMTFLGVTIPWRTGWRRVACACRALGIESIALPLIMKYEGP